jgi:hypothetical protein
MTRATYKIPGVLHWFTGYTFPVFVNETGDTCRVFLTVGGRAWIVPAEHVTITESGPA